MPELPEVETIKNVLKGVFINRKITDIKINEGHIIQGNHDNFINTLKNQFVLDITRKGKFIIFHLSNDIVLISHLRMEGKYFEYLNTESDSKYAKVIFYLDNNHKVCYDDSRGFGVMILSNEKDYLKLKELAKIGPEPWEEIDVSIIMNKVKNISTPIKTTLLSQEIISGLGNIYVDETLYLSKIHPHTPAKYISKKEWEDIILNSKTVMQNAIKAGGSTIKSYHPGKNIDGNFQTQLKIYGKEGNICPICGKSFHYIKTNGRGTTYCPGCQLIKNKQINLAVTGEIASGKTYACLYLKAKGMSYISCDEIVNKLYKNAQIINYINKMFSLNFDKEINHQVLRDYLLSHKGSQRKLESYIFPLVKKELLTFMKKEKNPLRVIEVPLLYESNFDTLFDMTLVITSDEKSQKERLLKRDGNLLNKQLAHKKGLNENKNKAEFLVSNSSNIEEFNNKLDEVFNKLKDRLN